MIIREILAGEGKLMRNKYSYQESRILVMSQICLLKNPTLIPYLFGLRQVLHLFTIRLTSRISLGQ
jgi:hypothetical protein